MQKATSVDIQAYSSILRSRWFWLGLIVVVLVLGSVWILFSQVVTGQTVTGNDAIQLEPAPVTGHPAPDFELKNLNGETIRLSDFKGKVVIVNFWATWCSPCRSEMPDLQQAALENAGELIVIGVNNTPADNPEQITKFVTELGVTFPIVLDETGQTIETYRVLGLPTTVFIDRAGVIQEIFTGPVNKAYIESKIPKL